MTTSQHTVLYDLVTKDAVPLSPWCWHVKMALAHKGMAHKGITVDTIPLRFTEKDRVIKAGGKSFPFMVEPDGTKFDDSKAITHRIEERYPEPTLFPGGDAGLAAYNFIHRYTQTILFPAVIPMIICDIPNVLGQDDQDYFIASREKRFGMSLSEFCKDRDDKRAGLTTQFDPFRKAILNGGYVAGSKPAMVDYILFGVLQWARVTSTFALYDHDDPLHDWMEHMLDLFDGYGRSAPACKN